MTSHEPRTHCERRHRLAVEFAESVLTDEDANTYDRLTAAKLLADDYRSSPGSFASNRDAVAAADAARCGEPPEAPPEPERPPLRQRLQDQASEPPAREPEAEPAADGPDCPEHGWPMLPSKRGRGWYCGGDTDAGERCRWRGKPGGELHQVRGQRRAS